MQKICLDQIDAANMESAFDKYNSRRKELQASDVNEEQARCAGISLSMIELSTLLQIVNAAGRSGIIVFEDDDALKPNFQFPTLSNKEEYIAKSEKKLNKLLSLIDDEEAFKAELDEFDPVEKLALLVALQQSRKD